MKNHTISQNEYAKRVANKKIDAIYAEIDTLAAFRDEAEAALTQFRLDLEAGKDGVEMWGDTEKRDHGYKIKISGDVAKLARLLLLVTGWRSTVYSNVLIVQPPDAVQT